ncbi:proline-specific peptidase [Polyplosphaeria fusca]|uniref:Proline-specific peptidase n=1 Tax=Polyplosphaeria fusca TaxID=682080 RepID=A0A9P4QYM0_9PLEO|nr:proline-specific peptidase [Polyplosphaeria fusca]
MANLPTKEGIVSFSHKNFSEPSQTWYKIVGDLDSTTAPVIITLHGGPGAGHQYMLPYSELFETHGFPVVHYDQIGCGKSTHYRDKMGDEAFWTMAMHIAELDNLIDTLNLRQRGYFLVGSSWGGMMSGVFASRVPSPTGLKKIVIESGPASIPLYQVGSRKLLSELPEDVRKTLEDCERKGDHESEEYQAAEMVFYKRHLCRCDPMPECFQASMANLKDDPTCYMTMQGPSEFVIVGSLRDWEIGDAVKDIAVPSLVTNGKYDEVQDVCLEPWNQIPNFKRVKMENSSHTQHLEEPEAFLKIVGDFLAE